MHRIEIEVGGMNVENPVTYLPGVIGTAVLLENKAPKICDALWKALPFETRTIHAFQAGQTWRTEKNYPLVPKGVVENTTEPWEPGSIIYLNNPDLPLFKVFFVYGKGKAPGDLFSVIAKVDSNLEGLVNISRRILYEGPKTVVFRRKE